MSLCQIVWISEATKMFSEHDLIALLERSRANNERSGITGLLLYQHGSFMQFMEGEETKVMAIYNHRIMTSHLHRDVTLMLKMEIENRIFGNWSMGFMTADSKLAARVPGFVEFSRTRSSFLKLVGAGETLKKLVDGFHAGRWHLHEEAL
jgi:hypothetical protein